MLRLQRSWVIIQRTAHGIDIADTVADTVTLENMLWQCPLFKLELLSIFSAQGLLIKVMFHKLSFKELYKMQKENFNAKHDIDQITLITAWGLKYKPCRECNGLNLCNNHTLVVFTFCALSSLQTKTSRLHYRPRLLIQLTS